ncbi:MAG: HipA N-terminal domain-containing protein [Lewinella sp.]
MRSSDIYYQDELAGRLWDTDKGLYHFQYDPGFVAGHSPPITPNLPKQVELFTSPWLFPIFYAMLSEGSLREFQEQAWKIAPGDDFGLLRATARHDTIGALTLRNTEITDAA